MNETIDPILRIDKLESDVIQIKAKLTAAGHPCDPPRPAIDPDNPPAGLDADGQPNPPEPTLPEPTAAAPAEAPAEGAEPLMCPQCLQPAPFPATGCDDSFHPTPAPAAPEID